MCILLLLGNIDFVLVNTGCRIPGSRVVHLISHCVGWASSNAINFTGFAVNFLLSSETLDTTTSESIYITKCPGLGWILAWLVLKLPGWISLSHLVCLGLGLPYVIPFPVEQSTSSGICTALHIKKIQCPTW